MFQSCSNLFPSWGVCVQGIGVHSLVEKAQMVRHSNAFHAEFAAKAQCIGRSATYMSALFVLHSEWQSPLMAVFFPGSGIGGAVNWGANTRDRRGGVRTPLQLLLRLRLRLRLLLQSNSRSAARGCSRPLELGHFISATAASWDTIVVEAAVISCKDCMLLLVLLLVLSLPLPLLLLLQMHPMHSLLLFLSLPAPMLTLLLPPVSLPAPILTVLLLLPSITAEGRCILCC